MHKINEIYAFVADGEEGEGIIGQTVVIEGRPVFMPFVCADKERMEQLKPLAKEIHDHTGQNIKIIKMTNRIELEAIG